MWQAICDRRLPITSDINLGNILCKVLIQHILPVHQLQRSIFFFLDWSEPYDIYFLLKIKNKYHIINWRINLLLYITESLLKMVQVKVNSFNVTFKELYTVTNYFVVYPIHVGSMQRICTSVSTITQTL